MFNSISVVRSAYVATDHSKANTNDNLLGWLELLLGKFEQRGLPIPLMPRKGYGFREFAPDCWLTTRKS